MLLLDPVCVVSLGDELVGRAGGLVSAWSDVAISMKTLRKDVRDGLDKGKAFERLKLRGGNLKRAARYLAAIPDPLLSERYHTANNWLMNVYALLVVLTLVAAQPVLLPLSGMGIAVVLVFAVIVHGTVLYLLYKKNAAGYWVLGGLMAKDAIDSLGTGEWFGVAIGVAMAGSAIFLKLKLFPFQNLLNLRKDADGYVVFK